MAHTPRQAAQSLYDAMPHGLSLDLLGDYGLAVSPEQARHVTQEMLALNLYWMRSALGANLRPGDVARVFAELEQCIACGWNAFDMPEHDPAIVLEDAQTRLPVYDQIVQEGGAPVAVFGEAAGTLEFAGAIEPGDRQKVLALFLDLVPVETFGELMDGLELSDS